MTCNHPSTIRCRNCPAEDLHEYVRAMDPIGQQTLRTATEPSTVSVLLAVNDKVHRELRAVSEENVRLRREVEDLKAQLRTRAKRAKKRRNS